jgi:O-antigen biosynthesis protein
MTPKFSILMLTYNRLDAVKECLASLQATLRRPDVHIEILDNASIDGTREWLSGLQLKTPGMGLTSPNANLGVAGGRAELLRYAQGDIIIFLDSDTVITDDCWLDVLAAALEPENVGLVGPGGSNMAADWSRFMPGVLGPVDCVTGSCQAFKREVLKAGVHLDLNYGKFWSEDSDFCLQIREAGYDVLCIAVPIIHNPGQSGDEPGLHQKNHNYFVSKWRGKGLIRCEGGY